jgi:hypothetical protein
MKEDNNRRRRLQEKRGVARRIKKNVSKIKAKLAPSSRFRDIHAISSIFSSLHYVSFSHCIRHIFLHSKAQGSSFILFSFIVQALAPLVTIYALPPKIYIVTLA